MIATADRVELIQAASLCVWGGGGGGGGSPPQPHPLYTGLHVQRVVDLIMVHVTMCTLLARRIILPLLGISKKWEMGGTWERERGRGGVCVGRWWRYCRLSSVRSRLHLHFADRSQRPASPPASHQQHGPRGRRANHESSLH